jgi:phosphate transport system substrate-binding protein
MAYGLETNLRLIGLLMVAAATACQSARESTPTRQIASAVAPSGPKPVLIDGSSTVLPISESVRALYAPRLVSDVKITSSGTGGGFKKFCRRQTQINGASRPITATEAKLCRTHGVSYIELPVAFDGLAVVVHQDNPFLESMTVEQLKKLWEPAAEGNVMRWKDLDPRLPDASIHLAGPGLDSGTFDFFTSAVVGSEHASRSDYKASENDHELVDFVANTPGALGYFGLAYYAKNRDRLGLVAIDDGNPDNGKGAIDPSPETVVNGTYQPLSRPVFIYVNAVDAERAEVSDFVEFYLRAARLLAPDVGYVALPESVFKLAQQRFKERKTGSIFDGQASVGLTIEELMTAETVAAGHTKEAPVDQ